MHQVQRLPSVFARYRRIGGPLQFAFFEDCSGTMPEIMTAFEALLKPHAFDRSALVKLGYRRIDQTRFLGKRYDPVSGDLIRPVKTGSGFKDQKIRRLGRLEREGYGYDFPKIGSGGEFAYAFVEPPMMLRASGAVVQDLFNEIKNNILPNNENDCDIFDWSHVDLPRVSDYFHSGAIAWNYVFLFSIYHREVRRLVAIAGAASD